MSTIIRREVVLQEQHWNQIQAMIEQNGRNESFAWLLAKLSRNNGHLRFLVKEVLVSHCGNLAAQGPTIVEPNQKFIRQALIQCLQDQLHLIDLHTHPFSSHPVFSFIDDANATRRVQPFIDKNFKGLLTASIVVGQEGKSLDARMWCADSKKLIQMSRVKVIGQQGDEVWIPTNTETDNDYDQERASRNVLAFGEQAQRKCAGISVAVVGLGGLGSIVVELLSRLPVRQLILIDEDHLARISQMTMKR